MLLSYLSLDILLRLAFQGIPKTEVLPYLLLPIGLARLSKYLLIKSFINIPNVLALVFWLCFAAGPYGTSVPATYIFFQALGLAIAANCLTVLLKLVVGRGNLILWITAIVSIILLFWMVPPLWKSQQASIGKLISPSPWALLFICAAALVAIRIVLKAFRRNLVIT